MDIKKLAGIFTSVAAIVGLAFVIDGRYWHADAAVRAMDEERKVQNAAHLSMVELGELGDLRVEMKLARIRISMLKAKRNPTSDDLLDIESIREEMRTMSSRIAELQRRR